MWTCASIWTEAALKPGWYQDVARMWVQWFMFAGVCTQVYIYICMQTSDYRYIHTCTCLRVHICKSIYIYVHEYTCLFSAIFPICVQINMMTSARCVKFGQRATHRVILLMVAGWYQDDARKCSQEYQDDTRMINEKNRAPKKKHRKRAIILVYRMIGTFSQDESS